MATIFMDALGQLVGGSDKERLEGGGEDVEMVTYGTRYVDMQCLPGGAALQ